MLLIPSQPSKHCLIFLQPYVKCHTRIFPFQPKPSFYIPSTRGPLQPPSSGHTLQSRGSWRKTKDFPHHTSHLSIQLTVCLSSTLFAPSLLLILQSPDFHSHLCITSLKKYLLFPTSNNPCLHFPNALFLSVHAKFPEFTLHSVYSVWQ